MVDRMVPRTALADTWSLSNRFWTLLDPWSGGKGGMCPIFYSHRFQFTLILAVLPSPFSNPGSTRWIFVMSRLNMMAFVLIL